MFVHISLKPDAVGETISTLKFAERVATVELGAACVNKDSSDVKELKEEVRIIIFAFNVNRKRGDSGERERAAKRKRGREKVLEQRHCGSSQSGILGMGREKFE
ncbi:P-loop nucleoside triphosphate hydrolase superfamily protein with CH (Calponin-like proteiny) domain [Abeliophyllum distichum]|uniref:P-loop nucleoside triphosphate hydrolase superfamily protein with CH (Calponin-like proteiny) domain n=1 Tax=Abeliophyllum distichum TaxID=126358 RepID=A0ABD1RBW1_9LAMI